ncbi:hypothetical protein MWU60_09160 [Yoonia sp. F2084L]|uniref:hypothetical protein n=1 Tax=Yoonia sp. F2084L TaxID=2926419 RepID=UPI001FF38980|nr:hypothetical protein [Yoonia sp. F2084L]MCK0095738.1 hypothetical protein [Yoonia sp. F2084L]
MQSIELLHWLLWAIAFVVAAAWTLVILGLTSVPITIGGSGLPATTIDSLELALLASSLVNGVLVAWRFGVIWMVSVAGIQRVLIALILGRTLDWYDVYFIVLLVAGLLVIGWLAGALGRLLDGVGAR